MWGGGDINFARVDESTLLGLIRDWVEGWGDINFARVDGWRDKEGGGVCGYGNYGGIFACSRMNFRLCRQVAMISERLLRVFLGSAFIMASFSAEHKAHLPDSGVKEGTTLNSWKVTLGFFPCFFNFQKWVFNVVDWILSSFLKEAV